MALPENPIADYPVTVMSVGVAPVIYAAEVSLSAGASATINVVGLEASPQADQVFEVTIGAVLDAVLSCSGRADLIIQTVVDTSIPSWQETLRYGLLVGNNRLSGVHLPGRYVRFRFQNYETTGQTVTGFLLFRALNVGTT